MPEARPALYPAPPVPRPQAPPAPTVVSDPRTSRASGAALASLVLALAGPLLFFTVVGPLITAIVAVTLGHGARRRIQASDGAESGMGMATAGVVIGWLELALHALVLVFFAALIVFSVAGGAGGGRVIRHPVCLGC